jgi:hypothetical protein
VVAAGKNYPPPQIATTEEIISLAKVHEIGL